MYFLNIGCHVSSGTAWSLDVVLVVIEKSNNQETFEKLNSGVNYLLSSSKARPLPESANLLE